jgi:hypothetical protein
MFTEKSIFELQLFIMELKFVTDEKGRQIEVIVPIAEWRKMEKKAVAAKRTSPKKPANEQFKKALKKKLAEGLKQVKLHQEGKIKLKSARQLLNEL